jgi:hypothetical protein
MTRTVATLGAFLSLAPCGAHADRPMGFMTGNELLSVCDSSSDACIAYVMGVVDMGVLAQLFGQTPLAICVPHGVMAKQLNDIVMRSLREHPQNQQAGAASLILFALRQTWPCLGQ